jgi:hypothetical protein
LEDLPEVTIAGWEAGEWSFNEETCCATIDLYPETCDATFVDVGFLDYNSNTVTSVCKNYVLLYNETTAPATYEDGVIYPPDVYCPPCNDPFVCGTRLYENQIDIATRLGLLYAPTRITLSICYQDVLCPYLGPIKKYVVTSTYYFEVQFFFKKYTWISTRDEVTAGGCCTGGGDFSNYEPEPDFSSPLFWGITFDCDSLTDPGTLSHTRYKTFNSIPGGVLTFEPTDCGLCDEPPCVTEFCFDVEGVSDPTNGGITLECAEMEVRTVECEIAEFDNRCDGLYWFIDPAQPELGIQCDARPPIASPDFPTCGPFAYTKKQIFAVEDATPLDCALFSECSGGGDYTDCLVDGECPDPSVILSQTWSDTELLTWDSTCTGGSDQEVCIPIPEWSVTLS